MEVSKALKETITTSFIKKRNVGGLMKMLTTEKEVKDEEKDNNKEEE